MENIKNLNRETIKEAISVIKNNPKKRNGRESTTYDLKFEGEFFPPILVLSEANKLAGGEELTLNDFNNSTDKAFAILKDLNFEINPKNKRSKVQENLISEYKEIIKNDQNKDELYKWKLIKEFQEKWNIDAIDFSGMLRGINFSNLVDYRSLFFVNSADKYPEEARKLFKMLYNEEIPLKKRISDFGERAEQLVHNVDPDKGAFQDERTIATYLTFKYPDKYSFYKYSIYSDFIGLLDIEKKGAGARYIHYLSLIEDFIDDYINNDDELIELSRSTLTEDCFVDDNYNILAQDILFRTTQQNHVRKNESENSFNFEPDKNNVWIEKTIVKNRADRETGDYRLGKRLWSPIRDARGADIYKNMRNVEKGDLILHLTDNEGITGVSIASSQAKEGTGVKGTDWEGDAYIVELENFTPIEKIDRDRILNKKNKQVLDSIREENDVFYNVNLNLRQGAYLTECPLILLKIINSEYRLMTERQLPFLEFKKSPQTGFEMDGFISSAIEGNLIFSTDLITRFSNALLTKPFIILTGLSGSGKTKLAQAFAKWIVEEDKQLNLVPVGADWTNREPLLGYPNALEDGKYVLPESGVLQLILSAKDDPYRPYFLILDEMNLSHVERYFADFLSAIESEEEIKLHSGDDGDLWDGVPPTIKIPKNLFIIGTVNIDETTYMFSPKVLDRANVIEFRVSKQEMKSFLEAPADVNLAELEGKGAGMAKDFVDIAISTAEDYSEKNDLTEELLEFFDELTDVGAEFGYRTAFEINRFASLAEQLADDWEFEQIMDAAISQKLLPKLHGSRRKLENVLFKLGQLCITEGDAEELLKKPDSIDWENNVKYPISLEKIVRMHKGLIENGFTSFAEA